MMVDRSGSGRLSGPAGRRVCLFGAALFLVLAGLVSMHGLGTHGIGGGMNHAAMTDRSIRHVAPDTQTGPLHDARQGTLPAGALCLAVLSFVAVVLLLRCANRISGQVKWPAEEPGRRSVPPRARAPDRPSLAALSILRC
jgi:hypothetical protein